jgi:serine/threonine protein kinase
VAVKTLHPHVLENSSARKRFVNEALSLSRLNHPHICTVYEIGDEDGRTFIAMEYVKGNVLSSLIPRDGLPLETMLRYGTHIADALTHAHQHGLIHRDLKAGNVVVTTDANAKVLDFGLAKHIDPASAATKTDTMSGTPAIYGSRSSSRCGCGRPHGHLGVGGDTV